MEGHALAQLERIGLAVRRDLPAFGELRLDLPLAVNGDKAFENVLPRDLTDGDGGCDRRVEAGRLDRHSKCQRRLGCGLSFDSRERQPECGAQGKGQGGTARKLRRLRKISAWHHYPLSDGPGFLPFERPSVAKRVAR